jgi:CHASE3 domain sensor protein
MVKRLIALQLSSILICVMAVISFVTVYSLLESFNWINHTYQVVYQLHRSKDDLADCQTSIRESIFSENKDLLALYIAKSPQIEAGLDNLQ